MTNHQFKDCLYNILITYQSGKTHAFSNVRLSKDGMKIKVIHPDGHIIKNLKLGMWKEFEYKEANIRDEHPQ